LFPGASAADYGTTIQGISGDGKIVLYALESSGLRIFDRQADRITGSLLSDFIDAARGNDVIDVRGGGKDTVNCGPGRDLVRANRGDRIGHSCERVIRRP
jgi:Ca2+-binding RTX toxin-like protein